MQNLGLFRSSGETMNHSLKFLRHTRCHDLSVVIDACTVHYRERYLVSIYRWLFEICPWSLRSPVFLAEIISLQIYLFEAPLNSASRTLFDFTLEPFLRQSTPVKSS